MKKLALIVVALLFATQAHAVTAVVVVTAAGGAQTMTIGGQQLAMVATCTDDQGIQTDCTTAASWQVVPPTLATIDAQGHLTATAAGSITVMAKVNGVSGQMLLTVTPK